MEWQEYIIFHANFTGITSREEEELVKSAIANYKQRSNESYSYLELRDTSGRELKTSCGDAEKLINGSNSLQ